MQIPIVNNLTKIQHKTGCNIIKYKINTIFIPLKVHLTPCHYLQIRHNKLTYTHIDIGKRQNRA